MKLRFAVVAATAIAIACVAAAARPAASAASSSCTVTGGDMTSIAGGATGIDPRVFCSDGTAWKVEITPEYESGGTWHSFTRSGIGTSALITMPVNACDGKASFTNDSSHQLFLFYDDGATCSVEGGSGPYDADVPHTLSPNPCNQSNERVEYAFYAASGGPPLRDTFAGPSHPNC